ncbi:hypothetical protein P691DRAFT_724934 [Macrolepiota fuliginosa MF-IS2]|uniref:Cerato-platanin n=1 Tax=Macrolepiota fuliginosa MF-IS2 TaxID=1400762 RepID=A0A9P5XII7_9AGAR|nr:hypothetical protein P691DRAFT_724934 [Macrolepiota fuliginosa MF-IS2]
MQFTSTFFALFATVAFTVAQPPAPGALNFDTLYDNPKGTLGSTACSADVGILKGHTTFGSIPNFPHIAGSFLIEGFNSTRCGACYELLYNRADGKQVVIPFTIINTAPAPSFVSSLQGVTDLTGLNRDQFPGDAVISFKEVPSIDCGF